MRHIRQIERYIATQGIEWKESISVNGNACQQSLLRNIDIEIQK